ncbi:MAG: hypothetical protein RJA36_1600 [Pseudomonadota bacterium]|jgi:hypothetical protein
MSKKHDQAAADQAAADQAAVDQAAANQAASPALVKARVIFAGPWGAMDQVVQVTPAEAEAGRLAGELDDDPGAVAYAESLAT